MVFKKKNKKGTEKINKFMNFFDIGLQWVSDYFNKRYKIEKRVSEIKNEFIDSLYSLKRHFFKAIIEALFLVTGILAFLIGGFLILNKYFYVEYLLLIYGVIITVGVVLGLKLRR